MSIKYRSNPHTDGDVKIFLSIYKCVPSIMALNHIGTEKYHKVSKPNNKVNEIRVKAKDPDYRCTRCQGTARPLDGRPQREV